MAMQRRQGRWVPAVNWLLDTPARSRSHDAGVLFAAIEAAAARRAGVREPADAELRAGMRVLLESYLAVDGLTPLGLRSARAEIGRRIENSLRLRQILRHTPQIGAVRVRAPVFIVGLPRTGTTLLHGLLSCAESLRAPLLWEMLSPCAPGAGQAAAAARIARAQCAVAFVNSAMPAMRSVHPMGARRPEECVFALPHSLAYHVRAPVPGYRQWLDGHDATADYGYLRQQLQVLQWRQPERRWILKSPFHLLALDGLLATFPDATIIWTHRDPATVMASWCSLVETVRLMHVRSVDPRQISREWTHIWSAATDRALAVRSSSDPAQFQDVTFQALTDSPLATAETVLRAAGCPLGPAFRARAHAALHGQASKRAHRHAYAPDHFGLEGAAVRACFAGYLAVADALPGPARA
jgi:hypothetical protein